MTDVVIIGCGVTGSAIAYELAKYKLNILILDKENDVSEGATKANSGIIHAGYDPETGSLMAKLNLRGSELAEEICSNLDVPYNKIGALVIAFNEEDKKTVETLYKRGIANGVKELQVIDSKKVKELEPNLSDDVICALYAPTSAVVSPWEYCLAMAETAIKNGAELKLNTNVTGIEKKNDCYVVHTNKGDFETKYVINAAGCESDQVHDMAEVHSFDIQPGRGEYYLLDKSEGSRVSRTIFQCPSKVGKGVLVSPTVHGNLIVGPNSESIKNLDVSTTGEGLKFVKETSRKSVPSIDFSFNIRNFSGIRAKSNVGDFIITEKDHFIDAAGICSPGLSSAPAIGEYVAELIEKSGYKLEKKTNFINTRKRIKVKELSSEEKIKLIKENPDYGEVVCRCETITKGEILATFDTPIPPCSLDGVKRRVSTGMGRCQGGFCSPIITEILSEKLGQDMTEVIQDKNGSRILTGRN